MNSWRVSLHFWPVAVRNSDALHPFGLGQLHLAREVVQVRHQRASICFSRGSAQPSSRCRKAAVMVVFVDVAHGDVLIDELQRALRSGTATSPSAAAPSPTGPA